MPPPYSHSARPSAVIRLGKEGGQKSRKKQFCHELWEKVEASTQEQMALIVGPMRNKPHHTHHSDEEEAGDGRVLNFEFKHGNPRGRGAHFLSDGSYANEEENEGRDFAYLIRGFGNLNSRHQPL